MFAKLFDVIKKNDLLKLLIIVVIGFLFFKFYYTEGLENVEAPVQAATEAPVEVPLAEPIAKPIVQATLAAESQQLASVVADQQQLTTEDLLPKYDEADEFVKQNPVAKLLKEQNFLISGYHMGINTQVSSNKIPYHDLRSAPPVPKDTVSPWLQSSYEEPVGAGRRQLEVGA